MPVITCFADQLLLLECCSNSLFQCCRFLCAAVFVDFFYSSVKVAVNNVINDVSAFESFCQATYIMSLYKKLSQKSSGSVVYRVAQNN